MSTTEDARAKIALGRQYLGDAHLPVLKTTGDEWSQETANATKALSDLQGAWSRMASLVTRAGAGMQGAQEKIPLAQLMLSGACEGAAESGEINEHLSTVDRSVGTMATRTTLALEACQNVATQIGALVEPLGQMAANAAEFTDEAGKAQAAAAETDRLAADVQART